MRKLVRVTGGLLVLLVLTAASDIKEIESAWSGIVGWFGQNWKWFTLTFVLTLVFGSLNFLKMLPRSMRWRPSMIAYFIVWVLISFLFAVIIIGAAAKMGGVNIHGFGWDIFFLSLGAAAFPELAANLKLQFADAAELNIHQYRVQLGDLLKDQMQSEFDAQNLRDLECITNLYTARIPLLLEKLYLFRSHPKIEGDDLDRLNQLIEVVERHKEQDTSPSVANLLGGYENLGPGLSTLFKKEIHDFGVSPGARLMHKLMPVVTIVEARKLVTAGVSGPVNFRLKASFGWLRRRLASKTGLQRERIEEIFHTTQAKKWSKRRRRAKWLLAFLFIFYVIGLIYFTILSGLG